jgi:hypothetical protein
MPLWARLAFSRIGVRMVTSPVDTMLIVAVTAFPITETDKAIRVMLTATAVGQSFSLGPQTAKQDDEL